MTELKAAKLAALAHTLEHASHNLWAELQPRPAWLESAYRFPEAPTLENVTKTLTEAIDWHLECAERCAYCTYSMIVDTCIWISMAKLTTNQIHELCVLLNRLYHEALGKWG